MQATKTMDIIKAMDALPPSEVISFGYIGGDHSALCTRPYKSSSSNWVNLNRSMVRDFLNDTAPRWPMVVVSVQDSEFGQALTFWVSPKRYYHFTQKRFAPYAMRGTLSGMPSNFPEWFNRRKNEIVNQTKEGA